MMLAPWVLLPVILAPAGCRVELFGCWRRARRWPIALMGAVNAVATLTGCLAAVIWWACHRPNRLWWRFTGLVGGVRRARGAVVGGRAGAARPDQPAVPRLHRILRRHHAVDVADRDAARHRRLDAVRRAERHRGRLAGHRVGRGAGDHVGRGRRAWPGWRCDRCPPAAGSSRSCWSVSSLLAVGYSGGLGSPVAHQVQAFLDAGGTPLRNMHKLEPLLRLPLALGLAHLLGRIPLPGSAPRRCG